ncbi:MAG: hypothetical protein ACLQE9_10590 [Roseiarcus sp.]
MSESEPPSHPEPCSFALTAQEAKVAASRAGLRAALSRSPLLTHVAPLVGFLLLVAFVAILTATGLLGRRPAEAALIVGAIAFMASRMAVHWRLRGARAISLAAATALQNVGQATVRLDDSGLQVESAAGSRRLAFADCDEAEDAGGMIYLWPRDGEPAFIPARAFPNDQAAQEFLALVRAGVAGAAKRRV